MVLEYGGTRCLWIWSSSSWSRGGGGGAGSGPYGLFDKRPGNVLFPCYYAVGVCGGGGRRACHHVIGLMTINIIIRFDVPMDSDMRRESARICTLHFHGHCHHDMTFSIRSNVTIFHLFNCVLVAGNS